jgi:hypothetical protein
VRGALVVTALLLTALHLGAEEPRDELLNIIPWVAFYVPEGQAAIRLSKLVRSSLYATEFEYGFVSGDIAAFHR